jgi:alpha-1,3-glucan synthase
MRGFTSVAATWLGLLSARVSSFEYDERYVGYNLNENPNANGPLEYWGKWENVSDLFFPLIRLDR